MYLLQNINNNFINYFDLYLDYQKNIGSNFLLIEEEEYGDLNSLPICYRPLYGIDFFIFKFKYKVLIIVKEYVNSQNPLNKKR